MLGKLIKYDFKSMFKSFVPLWVALLVVSGITAVGWRSPDMSLQEFAWMGTITNLVYGSLIVAVMALTVVLIIQRFYKGLLGDEGYLMFTLPVRTWQLVAAKTICATVVVCISSLVAALSVVIIALPNMSWDTFVEFIQEFKQYINGDHVLIGVLALLIGIAGVVKTITQVYLSLAMGHLANKHRIALSVVSFIVINTVLTWIATFIVANERVQELANKIPEWFLSDNMLFIQMACLVCLAIFLVQAILFFVGTERILNKKLNLE